jgi:hypothetical protein
MTPQEIVNLIAKTYHFTSRFEENEFNALIDDLNLPNCSADAGATKGVIIFRDAKFVIKIPFTGYTEYDNYNIEYNGAFKKGVIDWDDAPEQNWDYCRLETAIYEAAERENLGIYFAKEELIGRVQEHPIYMQQKCKVLSEMSIDYNSKEYTRKKSVSEQVCEKINFTNFNSYWIADFIDTYGEYEFGRLAAFIQKYDIDDLRACNVGYYDGAPILFDYSGYNV